MRVLIVVLATALLAIPAAGQAQRTAAPPPPLVFTGDQSLLRNFEIRADGYQPPRCGSAGCDLYPNLGRAGFPRDVRWVVTPSTVVNLEMRVQDSTGADFYYAQFGRGSDSPMKNGYSNGRDLFLRWWGEPGVERMKISPNSARPGVYRVTTSLTDITNPARVLSIGFNIVVKKPPAVIKPPRPKPSPTSQGRPFSTKQAQALLYRASLLGRAWRVAKPRVEACLERLTGTTKCLETSTTAVRQQLTKFTPELFRAALGPSRCSMPFSSLGEDSARANVGFLVGAAKAVVGDDSDISLAAARTERIIREVPLLVKRCRAR